MKRTTSPWPKPKATLLTPQAEEKQTTRTVGLVGLHIVPKVQGAQQRLWATFEQIDNAPDQGAGSTGFSPPTLPANPNQVPTPAYTYFNNQCSSSSDPYYERLRSGAAPQCCDQCD